MPIIFDSDGNIEKQWRKSKTHNKEEFLKELIRLRNLIGFQVDRIEIGSFIEEICKVYRLSTNKYKKLFKE